MDTKAGTGILTRLLRQSGFAFLVVISGFLSGIRAQEVETPPLAQKPVEEVSGESRQLRRLVGDLVRVRAEVEAYRKRLALREAEEQSEAQLARRKLLASRELLVLDANPELAMVVLNAGSWREVRPGMAFAVRREGRTVAHAVVIDVREQIAGALVEKVLVKGEWPVAGDRAILLEKKE